MKTPVICTTLLIEKSPQSLPLGAACIASSLNSSKLTKDLCQASLKAFCIEDEEYKKHAGTEDSAALYLAEKLKAPIVCFSVFVWNKIILEKTAELLQKQGSICIAGGPEITANPGAAKGFDYLVCGEGEVSLPSLISDLLTDKRPQRKIIPASSIKNLEELSSPYLDNTLDPLQYGGALWELARGCPFKCSYCYESKGEKIVRHFNMQRIEAELDLFAKKKIPQVFVLDPTYNANKERAIKLLNLIAKKTPDTFYYFEARAEFIDNELARAFSKIPCALQIGLQSANEEVLKLVNRPFNKKNFIKKINILNQAGLTFGFDLIYGLPGESFASFKEGINFALSLYPNNLEIFCLSVLPGTDLHERAAELGLQYQEMPPYNVTKTSKFSPEDLKNAGKLAAACNVFYNDGRAVPWFNIICRQLKLQSWVFLNRFYNDFLSKEKRLEEYSDYKDACNREDNNNSERLSKVIEEWQLAFVLMLAKEKGLSRFNNIFTDLIHYYGALSRSTESGKRQKISLNYPAEYLESEYIFDLEFFLKNVKLRKNSIEI